MEGGLLLCKRVYIMVIVYFGGNDAVNPHRSGLGVHVPLPEYVEKIYFHLRVFMDFDLNESFNQQFSCGFNAAFGNDIFQLKVENEQPLIKKRRGYHQKSYKYS